MSKKIFQGLPAKRQQELCETLETHPNIHEIHFTKEGEHHFNVYDHNSGRKFGHISEEKIRDTKKNVTTVVRTPNLKTLIVETATRDELLGNEAKADNSKEIKKLDEKVSKLERQLETTKDVAKVADMEAQIEDLKSQISELE